MMKKAATTEQPEHNFKRVERFEQFERTVNILVELAIMKCWWPQNIPREKHPTM